MKTSLVLSGRGQGAGGARPPATVLRPPPSALRPPPSHFRTFPPSRPSREPKEVARCELLVTRHPSPATRYQAFVHVHLQVHGSFPLPPLASRLPPISDPRPLTSDHRLPASGLPPSTFHFPRASGFALVATLLMITVITGAAVAFFQSTRIERFVSRNYADLARAQLAGQAGLSAGQAAILNAITNGRISTNQWNYVSGHLSTHPQISVSASNADANAFAFIAQVDPANGSILNTNFLVSTSADASNVLIPLGQTGADPRYPAHWTNIVVTNASGVVTTNARYAFWISDDTTKLNLRAMGRQATRTYPTDPSGFALMTRPTASSSESTLIPSANLAPLFGSQAQQAADGSTNQGWNGANLLRPDSALFTPGTVKAFMTNSSLGPIPTQSLENDFARETLSVPLAPKGRPKLNLTRLAYFLRHPDDGGLALNQGSASPRAQAVLNILDATATNYHTNWGGGDLSFLVDPTVMGGKYTVNEARQFVANLFDALDPDKIPTTDWNAGAPSTDPTFLGTEFWMDTGKPQGHPFIVYVAGGYWASATSCRSHLAVGFANPWPEPTENWSARYRLGDGAPRAFEITPSISEFPKRITENGTPEGGLTDAMPVSADINSGSGEIKAQAGGLFPCARNPNTGATDNAGIGPHFSAVAPMAAAFTPTSLSFTINKINLYYFSTAGSEYLVSRVPNPVNILITNNAVANSVNNLAYGSLRQALWLKNDPRFGSLGASYWTTFNNGAIPGGSGLGTIPTSVGGGGLGGAGGAGLSIMPSTGTDGVQGLATNIVASSSTIWFRDTDITNHFNMDGSLAFVGGTNRIRGLGFLGYINSGKPWRTISFTTSNNPAGQEDWKILDYVYAGEEMYVSNEIAHVNMGAGTYASNGTRGSWPGNFSRDGSVNVHTANRNTWKALLEGVPLPSGVSADGVASAMVATNRTTNVYSNTLAFLADPDVSAAWLGTSTNDFAREQLFRYLADALTIRSRSFTIYAMGESLATNATGGVRPVARSLMLSRIRLGVNTNLATTAAGNGGGVTLELLETKPY